MFVDYKIYQEDVQNLIKSPKDKGTNHVRHPPCGDLIEKKSNNKPGTDFLPEDANNK